MATQQCHYGPNMIGLYIGADLVGMIDYPHAQGRFASTPNSLAFAGQWKAGVGIDELRARFPDVSYRPNNL